MTVGSNLSGGFALLRNHPGAVAIWAALYAAMNLAMLVIMQPAMASIAKMQQAQLAGAQPDPGEMLGAMGPLFLLYPVILIVLVAFFAAVVRATTRAGSDSFGFLRFGMDELRLIGLGVLFVVAFFVVYIIAVIIIAALGGIVGVASPTVGVALAGIAGFAFLCFLIWAQIRLSLTGAMTVMQGRIVVTDGWRATKGHFWTLLGTSLVLWLGFLLIALAVVAMTNPGLLAAYAGGDAQGIMAASQGQMAEAAGGLSIAMILKTILGAALYTIGLAIYYGAIATAAVDATGGAESSRNLEDVFS